MPGRSGQNVRGPVLVTGVAGFIGARTAALLLEQGRRVVGLDNLNDYYDVRLKHHRLEGLRRYAGFSFVPGDVEDLAGLEGVFREGAFEAVLNLAARAGVRGSIDNPHIYFGTNAVGTLNVLECMRRFEVGKLVLASTSSLYAGLPTPFVETLPVNTPISPYAASKKAAETMAYTYHHLYGIDVSVLRYFTVYGPAGRPDMSPLRFIRWIDEGAPVKLFGDGSQRRDFTYVDDIAAGTIAALRPVGYEVINLGGGTESLSMNALIALIEQHLGRPANVERQPAHKADMQETLANVDKARTLLGWEPAIRPEEGIARTVAWHRGFGGYSLETGSGLGAPPVASA